MKKKCRFLCHVTPLVVGITRIRQTLALCLTWALISIMPLALGVTLQLHNMPRLEGLGFKTYNLTLPSPPIVMHGM
jgi:hypothetical protein